MQLSTVERGALVAFAKQHGRQWKAQLRFMWERGSYFGSDTNAAVLQAVRNRIGPSGLAKVRPIDLFGPVE